MLYAHISHTIDTYNVRAEEHTAVSRCLVDACVRVLMSDAFGWALGTELVDHFSSVLPTLKRVVSCATMLGSRGYRMLLVPERMVHVVFGSGGLWSRARLLDARSGHGMSDEAVIACLLSARIVDEIIRQTVGSLRAAMSIADMVLLSESLPDVAFVARAALREAAQVRVQQLAFGVGLRSYDAMNEEMGGFMMHMHVSRLMDECDEFYKVALPYLERLGVVEQKHGALLGCLAWCFGVPAETMEMAIFSRTIEPMYGHMTSNRYRSLCEVLVMEISPSTTFLDWCVVHLRWRRSVGYDTHHRSTMVSIGHVDCCIRDTLMEDMLSVAREYAEAVYAPKTVLESAGHTLAPARLCGFASTDIPRKQIALTDD